MVPRTPGRSRRRSTRRRSACARTGRRPLVGRVAPPIRSRDADAVFLVAGIPAGLDEALKRVRPADRRGAGRRDGRRHRALTGGPAIFADFDQVNQDRPAPVRADPGADRAADLAAGARVADRRRDADHHDAHRAGRDARGARTSSPVAPTCRSTCRTSSRWWGSASASTTPCSSCKRFSRGAPGGPGRPRTPWPTGADLRAGDLLQRAHRRGRAGRDVRRRACRSSPGFAIGSIAVVAGRDGDGADAGAGGARRARRAGAALWTSAAAAPRASPRRRRRMAGRAGRDGPSAVMRRPWPYLARFDGRAAGACGPRALAGPRVERRDGPAPRRAVHPGVGAVARELGPGRSPSCGSSSTGAAAARRRPASTHSPRRSAAIPRWRSCAPPEVGRRRDRAARSTSSRAYGEDTRRPRTSSAGSRTDRARRRRRSAAPGC